MKLQAKISNWQFIILLVVSRSFTLISYTPKILQIQQISDVLIGYVVSVGLEMLIIIPFFLLYNQVHTGIIDSSILAMPKLGKIFPFVYAALAIILTGYTMANFIFYLSSIKYKAIQPVTLLSMFFVVVLIAVILGIQGLARFSSIVFTILIIMISLIFLTNLPKVDYMIFRPPFIFGEKSFIGAILDFIGRDSEIVALLILACYAKKPKQVFYGYTAISGAIFIFVSATTALSLGSISTNQLFPLHSASTISEVSVFKRFDSVFMIVWVFIAVVKCTLFLSVAQECLRKVISEKYKYIYKLATCILTIVIAIFLTKNFDYIAWLYIATIVLIPVFVTVVLYPSIVLIVLKIKKIKIADNTGGEV